MTHNVRAHIETLENADTDSVLDIPLTPVPVAQLPSGRRVSVSSAEQSEYLHVTGADGRMELTIRFTEAGPVLELSAVGLRLAAKRIEVACEELNTRVTGDMSEQVRGQRTLSSRGGTRITGRDVDLVADRGEARIEAAKDLRIDGKNVLINC